MEHESSFNKQMEKEITARAVKNKMIEVITDENNKTLYDVDKEIKTIKKLYVGGNRKIVNTNHLPRHLMS